VFLLVVVYCFFDFGVLFGLVLCFFFSYFEGLLGIGFFGGFVFVGLSKGFWGWLFFWFFFIMVFLGGSFGWVWFVFCLVGFGGVGFGGGGYVGIFLM